MVGSALLSVPTRGVGLLTPTNSDDYSEELEQENNKSNSSSNKQNTPRQESQGRNSNERAPSGNNSKQATKTKLEEKGELQSFSILICNFIIYRSQRETTFNDCFKKHGTGTPKCQQPLLSI